MTDHTLSSIESLLQNIFSEYRKHDAIIKASGERFNIFSILKLSRKEVRLHSAFIGELLSVNGSHGRGDFFLRLFFDQVFSSYKSIAQELTGFDIPGSVVHLEYNFGGISEDGTTGGRIDIRIDDNKHSIIIENKVDARDGENQLLRYSAVKNKIALLYLTPEGRDPDPASAKDLTKGKDYICISYKEHIAGWLQKSIEQDALSLSLDATIRQYLLIIKTLTTGNNMDNMDKAIISLLTDNDENLEASFHVSRYFDEAKTKRGDAICNGVLAILEKGPFEFVTYDNWTSFPYIELHPKEWKHHLIGFTEDKGLFYGIKRRNAKRQPFKYNDIKSYVRSNYRTSDWWLCYDHIHGETFDPSGFHPYLEKNYLLVVNTIVEKAKALFDIFENCRHLNLEW